MTYIGVHDYHPTYFQPQGVTLSRTDSQRIAIFTHDGIELGRRMHGDLGFQPGQKIHFAGQDRRVVSEYEKGKYYYVELGSAKN